MKASGYGIANLKYILGSMNAWIGAQDPDFSQRRTLYDEVLTQYIRYLNHVLANVGGIYFAEKMEGDPVEAYRSVPRERQREALLFCLAQLKDMKWLDNAELIRDMPLMGRRVDHGLAGVGRRGRPGACGFECRAGRKGRLHARGVPQGCL